MTRGQVANRLLGSLSAEDRDVVLGRSELVGLHSGETLTNVGETIGRVHFLESGFVSVIASEGERDQVEIGLIGREGMAGVSVALGCAEAPFRTIVQASGTAYQFTSADFRQLCLDVPSLQRVTLAFSQSFTRQVADTGRANARHTIESRLARWLLMAHDRLDDDDLSITHETLSRMLGVRRPGVTVSLHILEGERMIKATRGKIRILDRAKLDAAAKGSYSLPAHASQVSDRFNIAGAAAA